jgi:glycosyltransferase involved in cell wall biosynthesis
MTGRKTGSTESGRDVAFIRMASRPIPRVTRMMRLFSERGYRPFFVGAFRETGLAEEDTWEGWRVLRVGRAFPLLNGRRPDLYLRGLASFGGSVYRLLEELEPVAVHASDFEAAIPALIYSRLRSVPMIYNIHDNLAQRYPIPRFFRSVLNLLEGLAVRACTAALVPEEFRRAALPAWCRHKVRVVRNTPVDPGYAPEPTIDHEHRRRILFAGWLDWGRGIRQLLELIDRHPELKLALAGEGEDSICRLAESHPRIEWLGFLSHAGVIDQTRRSGFVAALYDPARLINRFAASNKIAEGLAVGRPVIVNSELEIAGTLRPYGCMVEVPYHEVSRIGPELLRIARCEDLYDCMCRSARRAYQELFDWNEVRKVVDRLMDELNGPIGRHD